MMRRVPEVLDCWFDSGSMPYAQVHYPFENREWFEEHFPADFIVEYIAQTRGWFYTLHVLATALFDRPPVRERDLPRDPAGRGRTQDLQAAAQLPGARPGLRHPRLRRAALVLHVLADPARPRPARSTRRAPRSPRWCAPCCTRSGTRTTSSPSTRTSTATGRRSGPTPPTPSTATSWPRPTTWSRPTTQRMDAYDIAGACAEVVAFSTSSTTGTSAAAATASGPPPRPRPSRRQGRRLRHALHGAGHAEPGGGTAAAAASPTRSTTAWSAATACTSTTGPSADDFPADDDLVAAMDRRPGRSPRPRCRCGTPSACGSACPCPSSPSPAPPPPTSPASST